VATNLERIDAFLRGKGLSKAQAAGVEGNLTVESSLNPSAYNQGENALGIAQWEHGRLVNLGHYAANTHGSMQSLDTQLGFLWSELQGSENGAYRALLAATTPAEAATVWDKQYERSAGTSRAQRIADANTIFGGGDPSRNRVEKAIQAGKDAVGGAVDAVTSVGDLFAHWQTDVMGLGMKLAAAGIAGTLVVVGAKQALSDKGN
jgi:hypothetical protein